MFYQTFLQLCSQKNVRPNHVTKELGLSTATATDWKKGCVPRDITLQKLADYFGVTVAYLKGETEEQKKPLAIVGEELSEGQRKLIEFARSVPEDKIDLILKVMQSIVEAD